MPEIIRGGRVEADAWRWLDAPATPAPAGPPPTPRAGVVVSLSAWKRDRDELLARGCALGVWLGPADEPAELAPDLHRLSLVAIHFPRFADGRGYSSAALLRTRHGYRGELRAIGDVGRDQLFYLKRCGFDSFELAPHRDPRAALAGLDDFSLRYQGSVDDPLPLFRKRAAARG